MGNFPFPQNLFHAISKETPPDAWTKDQIAGLYVALGQLVPKQQRVLWEKYLDGKSNAQIGTELSRKAGTVSTYHRKAMVRLRDPLIAAWYRDGYQRNVEACAAAEHWTFPIPASGEEITEADLALRIGIKVRIYEAMAAAGIITVGDLSGAAARDPRWYRNIPGVGPKTWEDMREKLIFFGLLQDRTREGEEDSW